MTEQEKMENRRIALEAARMSGFNGNTEELVSAAGTMAAFLDGPEPTPAPDAADG